jgi:hypothetical protein
MLIETSIEICACASMGIAAASIVDAIKASVTSGLQNGVERDNTTPVVCDSLLERFTYAQHELQR